MKIIGPSDSLEKIDKIDNIPVDVTGITKSKDIKVNVPVPDGIDSVSPKQITVHVEVDKQGDEKDAEETDASAAETKSFKNLPVSLTGQSSKYTYELLSPTSVDADVKGPKSDLDKLTKSGISLSANVGNLSAGEHTVPIIINSPDSVTSTLSTKQAKVRVTAKKQSGTNDEQTDDKETSGSTSDKETKPDTGTGSGTNPGTGNSGDSADKPSEETDTPEDNTDTPTDSTETGDDSSNQSDENSTPVDGQTDNTSGN